MPRETFAPSGFFVLRTPLLPRSVLDDLAGGLAAPDSHPDDLDAALARDRRSLAERLRALALDPVVREALFVSSPSFDEALGAWLDEPSASRAHDVPETLYRYVARMAARPTPFGLFAGWTTGALAAHTRLELVPRARYRRHTRLDVHYLAAVCDALRGDPSVRAALTYRPSTGLYPIGGSLRVAEAHDDPETREHGFDLISVESSPHLRATLERASRGARREELIAALERSGEGAIPREDAEGYVDSLIEGQVLVSDLEPPVTGADPLRGVLDVVSACASDSPVAARGALALADTRDTLAALDEGGLGHPPDRYRSIAARLEELPARPDLARLFQVDLHKPGAAVTLGPAVMRAVRDAVELSLGLADSRAGVELFRPFREALTRRYAERLAPPWEGGEGVPLVEVLDDETGIGFASPFGTCGDPSPLLLRLSLPAEPSAPEPFGRRERHLLASLERTLRSGASEWELTDEDLRALSPDEGARARLPDAFSVLFTLAAPSAEAIDRGDFELLLGDIAGPSGAPMLGRFCHFDAELRDRVEAHVRAEAALDPEALYAEIVHLPEGRMGNILGRPVLREFEIVYLGRSGVSPERRIPVDDLRLSLDGERIVLHSRRLGRRVVPRLSSAHNAATAVLPIYRFLAALQLDGQSKLRWDWGALGFMPTLPRVRRGRVVLAQARWRLETREIDAVVAARTDLERIRAVRRLRDLRGLPRRVGVVDRDQMLPVDFENTVSVAAFAHAIRDRGPVTVVERLDPRESCVSGPEGPFVHEVILPFVRAVAPVAPPPSLPPQRAPVRGLRRTFPPGSEWLYVKLYTGTVTADEVLTRVVAPLVARSRADGVCDRWFFVRYADPEWHLRLRFRGRARALASVLLPALRRRVAPLVRDGVLWKVALDTYEREVERYGGPRGIELAEALFEADSDAVLVTLEAPESQDDPDARWRAALRGCRDLLVDLGLDEDARRRVVARLRDAFAREHGVDTNVRHQLGQIYREERATLEALLSAEAEAPHALVARSARVGSIARRLWRREREGALRPGVETIASSLVHMHCNRVLRSEQRAHELVLYDLLARFYESRAARRRG